MPIFPNSTTDIATAILTELDHFQANFQPAGGALTGESQFKLKDEPCIGYAVTQKPDGTIVELFLCRNSVPFDYKPSRPTIDYGSYLSDMGRIITKKPGEMHTFTVRDRFRAAIEQHTFELKAKNEFRTKKDQWRWDGINNQIAWIGGRVAVRSLRNFLAGEIEGAVARAVSYSVQLPDQAILDEAQDDVFRLPLTGFILITGAPGTGKTTVLLKRLSQKTKKEFLSEAELKGITDQIFNDGENWMLFTPSDLLKVYLKEAMAKELLPATDEHVKVYRTFRLEVLRDSGFIKVGPHGFFKLAPPDQLSLKRVTGLEQLSLNKAFTEHLTKSYSQLFKDALQSFNNEIRGPLGQLTDANQKVLVTALDIMAKAGTDPIDLREAQSRAFNYRKLNEDLNTMVQTVRGIGETIDKIAEISPSAIYGYVGRWQRAAASLNTAQIDTAVFPQIPPLVSKLKKEIRDLNEALTLSRLFHHTAKAYQEFREIPEIQSRFFATGTDKQIRDRHISEPEQDVLLFHALEFTRQIRVEIPGDMTGVPDELRSMLLRFRLIVAVDEATDFSPLELACVERFALPQGGVTISGDPMQRVTETGLRAWEDMDSICSAYQRTQLNVSYRQTERLFNIARDLFKSASGQEPNFKSAYPIRSEDPPALSFKPSKEKPASQWLVDRVCEIFKLGNNHLPTTAILVPTPADVEPLKAELMPLFHENGLELDGSQGGQNLGDSARVRIFPVEHIKGLEFEAVFYIGLDRMAEIHKDLIEKYVYVGLSRARSFLGVTYDRQFPAKLQCIEHHFIKDGTWDKPVPPANKP